jgi:hypothetical protein
VIRRASKWFLTGYLAATFLNFATGWLDWRTVLDLLNGAVMGYHMTTGFSADARVLKNDLVKIDNDEQD